MQKIEIVPFTAELAGQVKVFTDRWIGKDYFELTELADMAKLSRLKDKNCSLLAFCEGELAGVRLSFAPGVWIDKAKGASLAQWKVPAQKTGYFKSLFIAEKFQRMGIGKILSARSLDILKKMGALAVVCHSWVESPGNSSQKYLKSMGFEAVKAHANFWSDIDYVCPRCAPRNCRCSAVEMIKYL